MAGAGSRAMFLRRGLPPRKENMGEYNKKYQVLSSDGEVLADNMDFCMALVFIEGFRNKFWQECIELTIKEIK